MLSEIFSYELKNFSPCKQNLEEGGSGIGQNQEGSKLFPHMKIGAT